MSYTCITFVGALINAQSAQNNSGNSVPDVALENLMGDVMLHLKLNLRVQFKEPSKMYKKLKKKNTFGVTLEGSFESVFVGAILKMENKTHLR